MGEDLVERTMKMRDFFPILKKELDKLLKCSVEGYYEFTDSFDSAVSFRVYYKRDCSDSDINEFRAQLEQFLSYYCKCRVYEFKVPFIPPCYSFIVRLLGDDEVRESVLQESLEKLEEMSGKYQTIIDLVSDLMDSDIALLEDELESFSSIIDLCQSKMNSHNDIARFSRFELDKIHEKITDRKLSLPDPEMEVTVKVPRSPLE